MARRNGIKKLLWQGDKSLIGAGLTGYLSLAKSDHSEGGITYESAKAKGFQQSDSLDSPKI